MTGESARERPPKYVIIDDFDAPQPEMVCQWVPGIGYCYLERRGTKPTHDGMMGGASTPIEAFGLTWTDNRDGTVSFYRTDKPVTATYKDGEPRFWQSKRDSFEYRRLRKERGKVAVGPVRITPAVETREAGNG